MKIFIGYDPKEAIAFHVLVHSIMRRASKPVTIIPLIQKQLRNIGIYTRERSPTESTEFSLTRFLVPYLSDYQGISVFMDCDMLCLVDIWELLQEPLLYVNVVKHSYTPRTTLKFDNHTQTLYPRKNWSSLMVFNNALCNMLTPEYVNSTHGLDLHQFNWLQDNQIGWLGLEYNWLVGEYLYDPNNEYPWSAPSADCQIAYKDKPKILHYTLGGPWFEQYRNCDHAQEWFEERNHLMN